jgi:hypothetical protein
MLRAAFDPTIQMFEPVNAFHTLDLAAIVIGISNYIDV